MERSTIIITFKNGKWHKHEWYHFLTLDTPSIYSKKKINSHDVWKCSKDNCWAFDIITTTLEKDEGYGWQR